MYNNADCWYKTKIQVEYCGRTSSPPALPRSSLNLHFFIFSEKYKTVRGVVLSIYNRGTKQTAKIKPYDRTSEEITSNSGAFSEAFYRGLDRNALIENKYTALKMTFHIDGYGEDNWIQRYDDPYIEIYSHRYEHLTTLYLGDYPQGDWAEHYADHNISLDNVETDGSFWVRYGNTKSFDS